MQAEPPGVPYSVLAVHVTRPVLVVPGVAPACFVVDEEWHMS